MITVFTPAYNRGYIIDNLYQSLKRQTYKLFEWIVIDDGSTDDTEEKFTRYLKEEHSFPIIYQKVDNGGKHRAINKGVQLAKGDLFFIVDSDDYLTDNSLEQIIRVEASIPKEQRKQFAGVSLKRGKNANEIIGKTFEGDCLDITMLERAKYGIAGDQAEVFYTDILKQYPFPEFDGEKFIGECVVWDKIAYDGYKMRFTNDIIYICEYLPDGLTANNDRLYDLNPIGYGLYIYQCGEFGKTFGIQKWNTYWEYYNRYRDKMDFVSIARNLHINPLRLFLRMFGMKLFFKVYDR